MLFPWKNLQAPGVGDFCSYFTGMARHEVHTVYASWGQAWSLVSAVPCGWITHGSPQPLETEQNIVTTHLTWASCWGTGERFVMYLKEEKKNTLKCYFFSFPKGKGKWSEIISSIFHKWEKKYLKSTPNLFPQGEETPVTWEGCWCLVQHFCCRNVLPPTAPWAEVIPHSRRQTPSPWPLLLRPPEQARRRLKILVSVNKSSPPCGCFKDSSLLSLCVGIPY